MSEKKTPQPSYAAAASGGFFLGVIGTTTLLFYFDFQPLLLVVPAVGLLSGILGAFMAAEPYEALRKLYDEHKARGGSGGTGGDGLVRDKLVVLQQHLGQEAARLVREAAAMGADGIKVAEAAEILRKEAAALEIESD